MPRHRATAATTPVLASDGGAHFLFPDAQFRREFGAEILRLEERPDLDLGLLAGHWIGTALHPVDGLLQARHLPDPESGDQFLGLRERAIDDRLLAALAIEAHALARTAGLEPVTRLHDAGLHQLLVELRHVGQQLFAGHDPGLGILRRFDDHHDTHVPLLGFWI